MKKRTLFLMGTLFLGISIARGQVTQAEQEALTPDTVLTALVLLRTASLMIALLTACPEQAPSKKPNIPTTPRPVKG
jgi:hypothetical protein